MAQRLSFLALLILVLSAGRTADAQTLTTEAEVTVGTSTQDVSVASTQVRAFGDVGGWRFYGDAVLADRHGREESDAFGAAYPYESKLSLMELKLEKAKVSGERLVGVRLGRYRTPFGIYGGSDQGYMGFLRAPLMRNSYYWALSNNYTETGASVVAGTTWLSAEATAAVPTDVDEYSRRKGLDRIIRVQAAGGPLIAGVSYIRTRPSAVRFFAKGETEFTGADLRWMKSGLQVRGEFIQGRPFLGAKTRAAYADVLLHRPEMGAITTIARIERLDYFAGPFSEFPRRYTLGVRVRMTHGLTAQVNYIHQPHDSADADSGFRSVDISVTYSIRRGLVNRRNR